jgi:hypothetical protein
LIPDLRAAFNAGYQPEQYRDLLASLDLRSGTKIEFRVAETPVFLPKSMLDEIAQAGADLTFRLLGWAEYLASARRSIPPEFLVAGESRHPNFLTADFALVRTQNRNTQNGNVHVEQLVPRLVEIQAFPSVFAYQALLAQEYSRAFDLPKSLGTFLGGLTDEKFWQLFRETVLGKHAPENVVLTEVDPHHQKTLPDFLLTAKRLGIAIVDVATLVPVGNKLHYRDATGKLIPIHRIYNRAIADEIIARKIELPFRLTDPWDVEWAGHPNWYFLISKYSVPWLAMPQEGTGVDSVVPPAVFLDDFLGGEGLDRLCAAGVQLPNDTGDEVVYENLLLKPLFSFAGKGIQFAPSRAELTAIPEAERGNYLLQQRMHFIPTIETPHGLTQAEIRILYLWPDDGKLTAVLPLIRLGRGKMMGVDHNRNKEWVGASAAFWR